MWGSVRVRAPTCLFVRTQSGSIYFFLFCFFVGTHSSHLHLIITHFEIHTSPIFISKLGEEVVAKKFTARNNLSGK